MVENKEKYLIIIRGLPGSGKTKLSKVLGGAICCADDYLTDGEGNYKWTPELAREAHIWCQNKCSRFMKIESISRIIISNTSTTEKELQPYYDLASEFGYTVFSIISENRHNGVNEHNVPEETLTKMKNRFSIKL